MRHENIHDFIAALEARQELVRIKAPAQSYLEITQITDRVAKLKDGGKALLFEKVEGSSFPVLTNAFGSKKRISLALGTDSLEELGERLGKMLEPEVPETLADKFRLLRKAVLLSRCLPRVVKTSRPACQEVVLRGDEVDLRKLPVLHFWPGDGGPYITFPLVFTKDPTSGRRNVGMYRLQVFDRNTTGIHWHIHKDGAHNYCAYEKKGERMEVAVAIGTDPVLTYAATAPLPRGIDEMMLAGLIRQKPVGLVKALTVDLLVPAEAEIILEGYVDPGERRLEGPFGDHTGYYSLPDLYPVFHVTAMTHRKGAVYSTTVVGRPPTEDCYLGLATERLFLPILRTLLPEIRDYLLPWEGGFHNVAVVAIDKAYPGQARKVIYGLWGTGQMSLCKAIVIVDAKVPLNDGSALLRHILSHINLQRDIFITEGILDALDHASDSPLWGGKVGIDATLPTEGERQREKFPGLKKPVNIKQIMDILQGLDDGFTGGRLLYPGLPLPLIILKIRKDRLKPGAFFRDILLKEGPVTQGIALLYDDETDIDDTSLILWKLFNNVDPRRDMVIEGQLMIIDGTSKHASDHYPRTWPGEAVMTEEVKMAVQGRIDTLGLTWLFEENA